MLKRLVTMACLIAACAPSAMADPVYGTDADPSGVRTGADLVLGGNYAGDAVSVAWDIVFLGGTTWEYNYVFTGFRQPDISHIILDLTDSAVLPVRGGVPADPDVVTDITTNADDVGEVEFGAFGPAPSNPGFPAGQEIVGVKFNFSGESPLAISFQSNRAPVWGDFYLKGGSGSFAYNPGLLDHTSMNVRDFIARPNGIVPEPASVVSMALGFGLVGLAAWRRSRAGTAG